MDEELWGRIEVLGPEDVADDGDGGGELAEGGGGAEVVAEERFREEDGSGWVKGLVVGDVFCDVDVAGIHPG